MTIKRKTSAASVETFIAGAPDAPHVDTAGAGQYEKGIQKGNKRQISLTIAPELLRVDEVAGRTGQGRAGIINMAIYRALEGDFFKG